jgi:hypothetical protein
MGGKGDMPVGKNLSKNEKSSSISPGKGLERY